MTVNLFLPQVTRIPITGPEPYNTLVCVSVESTMGPQQVREGHLSRFPMRVPTPFRLMGFDQRVPPVFDHSTTAWISSVGPCEDGRWVYAVDSVTGSGFTTNDGTYYIDLMAALSPSSPAPGTCAAFGPYGICFYFSVLQATSWVLCYEPPLPSHPQRAGHRFNDRLLVRDVAEGADRTPTPAQVARTATTDRIAQLITQRLGVSVSLAGGDVAANTGANPPPAHAPTTGCGCGGAH